MMSYSDKALYISSLTTLTILMLVFIQLFPTLASSLIVLIAALFVLCAIGMIVIVLYPIEITRTR